MWTLLLRSRIARLIAILAIVALAFFGWGKIQYRNGKKDVLVKIEEARGRAIEQKRVIDDEIKDLSDDDLLNRASEWLRPGR